MTASSGRRHGPSAESHNPHASEASAAASEESQESKKSEESEESEESEKSEARKASPATKRSAASEPSRATRSSPAEDALIEIVLVALADPMRRRILNGLSSAGGGTATTLAEGLPVTRQAVVKHLAVLQQAGLVVGRKIGREVRYSVAPAPLEETAQWMRELASTWDGPLATVKALAEDPSR